MPYYLESFQIRRFNVNLTWGAWWIKYNSVS